LDGFSVETSLGQKTLHTANAQVQALKPSFIEELLSVLTNPAIVFLLLSVGVQAILIELSSPGGWVAGFIGVVCISLAAYGLGVLPVNWFGIFGSRLFCLSGYQSAHDGARRGQVARSSSGWC
jgi:membrane-bound serine protease (ClpP class)